MATRMVKTRQPFDLLLNWHDYINYEFSAPEEKKIWEPQVDVREKDGHFLLKMKLPGVNLKDIHVDYKNGFLTIEGNRKEINAEAGIQNHTTERHNGDFKRVLRLPQGIDKRNIKKAFKNGILEIKIPVPYNVQNKLKTSS